MILKIYYTCRVWCASLHADATSCQFVSQPALIWSLWVWNRAIYIRALTVYSWYCFAFSSTFKYSSIICFLRRLFFSEISSSECPSKESPCSQTFSFYITHDTGYDFERLFIVFWVLWSVGSMSSYSMWVSDIWINGPTIKNTVRYSHKITEISCSCFNALIVN